jgi:predicted Zn-dependent protease
MILGTGPSAAQGLSAIRDAEIENTIRIYAAPLLSAADVEAEAVRFHIVRSPMLNAFVAGGQRMFLTTGLLRRNDDPGEVIGVMAHEIGHITGGHLARLQSSIRDASTTVLISQLVGLAVGVLAREPGAAVAVGSGGMHIAQRTLLKFSRTQERSADQAGLQLLERTGQSARGLYGFLGYLAQQELLHVSRQDRYMLTHPLTRNRVRFVRNHVDQSRYSNRVTPKKLVRLHRRLRAKLAGFIDPPAITLDRYRAEDGSVEARYARAIALYRIPDLANAVKTIDGLIAEQPRDPYFRELKGQMLFENGHLEKALPEYEAAVRLNPDATLLRVGLAHVQIELNRPDLLDQTLGHLKHALRSDPNNRRAWRLAATAYGRNGQFGMSSLSLAENFIRTGHKSDARGQAARAMRLLKKGSPAWLRAQDIITQVKTKY